MPPIECSALVSDPIAVASPATAAAVYLALHGVPPERIDGQPARYCESCERLILPADPAVYEHATGAVYCPRCPTPEAAAAVAREPESGTGPGATAAVTWMASGRRAGTLACRVDAGPHGLGLSWQVADRAPLIPDAVFSDAIKQASELWPRG
jgi:hypothetical protein